jgi:hypothetical protein
LQAESESRTENSKCKGCDQTQRHGVREVKLSGATFAPGKENNVHAVRSRVLYPVSAGRQNLYARV